MNPYTNDQEALPVPGVHPSSAPTVTVILNESWIPYIVGALDNLKLASFWEGTPAEIDEATLQAADLIGLFVEAT